MVKKILITGPESSGKSFLSSSLAEKLEGVLVQEYAREYLTNKGGYVESDLSLIAQKQSELENQAALNCSGFLFCDTGIEVVCIWSLVKYGRVDAGIRDLLQLKTYDLILLCKPNIPWEFDELREHGNSRGYLFEVYKDFLSLEKVSFKVVNAPLGGRVMQAVEYVNQIM
jgi:nicotinamide riboside kinase